MFDRFKNKEEQREFFTNMAPMADIVFLLLIFFMLTSAFVLEPGIDVELPRAVTAEEQAREKHVLTITEEGKLLLDEDSVSFDTLERILRNAYAGKPDKLLIIRADRQVFHSKVVRALDIARQTGIKNLAIATDKID
ncbi:MAG: ExbD/TolR family protein [Elusimicrobiota bacterium]